MLRQTTGPRKSGGGGYPRGAGITGLGVGQVSQRGGESGCARGVHHAISIPPTTLPQTWTWREGVEGGWVCIMRYAHPT